MPTVGENAYIWTKGFNWSRRGEEWSDAFGDSDMQWQASLMPRLRAFLPAGTVLEIASGFGRWSHYLRDYAKRLILVDLSETCIAACHKRFAGDNRIECHVNDGSSLPMVDNATVDLAFSFDSLVHADLDVMRSYAFEIARVLKPDGVAILHHSNLKPYGRYLWATRKLGRVRPILTRLGIIDDLDPPCRDVSMSAALFREAAAAAGLACVSQELINWNCRRLTDCISVLAGPRRAVPHRQRVVRNPGFMTEAAAIKRLSALYSRDAWSADTGASREKPPTMPNA